MADAFDEFFAQYHWPVRAYVLRRASAVISDDVVTETFVVAWRRFDEIGSDPLPWLLGVARRVLANHLRGERRRHALVRRITDRSEPAWEPSGASDQLGAALGGLSAREREALLLVAWEGLDAKRGAVAAGCSTAAFRVRLHRARRHVRSVLTANGATPTIAKEAP
jgi:RNA polymerase sigma-70 factor (ECF subfamily)